MTIWKLRALQLAFRQLPIPGSFLDSALGFARMNFDKLEFPAICTDRWEDIEIEITDPRDLIQKHILFQGYFEYYESKFLRSALKLGDTFLDVGANIGWHTLLAAKKIGATGRVIALEPASKTFAHLERNIRLNDFSNVQAFKFGLSTKNECLQIFSTEAGNAGANSLFANDTSEKPIETVEVRNGDEFLATLGISEIALCKIDVEGAEMNVLEGMKRIIGARTIRKLLIEINREALSRAGRTPDELIRFILDAGYKITEIRGSHAVVHSRDMKSGQNFVCELSQARGLKSITRS